MKRDPETQQSAAFKFLALCWESIPRKSWRNRNEAMYASLKTAVSSGMHFEPEDMSLVYGRFNAGYWIGQGDEGLYALAIKTSNTPAAIAFETCWKRPAVLWAEKTKTPDRLHVGSKFSWDGHFVTVTSMRRDSLIACTYKDQRTNEAPEAGDAIWHGREYRVIETFTKLDDGRIAMRLGAKPIPAEQAHAGDSVIVRRFTITSESLAAARTAYDALRKEYVGRAALAGTLDEVTAIEAEGASLGRRAFRHFDVEQISAAFRAARDRIKEAMTAEQREEHRRKEDAIHEADLARWLAGEDVPTYFRVVRLRVKGEFVETSTRQSATVQGVRLALAFIKKHKRRGWQANGEKFDLDQYPLQEISMAGVQVGCTLVPWSEVDRIKEQLLA